MTEHEGVLGRWSRLKRQAAGAKQAPATDPTPTAASAEGEADRPDPALPPIDSLGADSDYTAFLAPGVPLALQILALRKAWSSDPKIADFRGFAEYDWDYNAPGYGQLLPVDDIKRLCDRALGPDPAEPEADKEQMAEAPPPEDRLPDNS